MHEGVNSFSKGYKKSFQSLYYPKVHCPVCKEVIYAKALKCPNCKTDFTVLPYTNRISWQRYAMKVVLVISLLIGLAIAFSNAPLLLGVVIGLALYGLGYVIIQKIQSFINYNNKK